MYIPQETAERIKLVAKRRGKSIAAVLTEVGIGKNTISKMTSGSDVFVQSISKIADCLNCSVDFLIGRKETDNLKETELTEKEQELLDIFRQLNDLGQDCMIHNAKLTREDIQYQKYTDISKEA